MSVRPGDCCPKCNGGRIRTYSSQRASDTQQVRYVECPTCGYRTKIVVSAEHICRRSFYVEASRAG